MPCNQVAIQRLSLDPDRVAELIGNDQAREALRTKLEQVAGVGSTATIQTYTEGGQAVTYVRITVHCRDGRTADAILYTRAYGAHSGRPIKTDGTMAFQGRDRKLVSALSETIQPFADQVGRVAGREKLRKAVRKLATVTAETRLPDGTIVQRARI